MNDHRRPWYLSVSSLTVILIVSFLVVLISNDAAIGEKAAGQLAVSAYAPIKDLKQQVGFFLGRIEKDLANADEYGEEQQERIAKDASTLAAIGLLLGKHDQEHGHKKSARKIIDAANTLAEQREDHAEANQAFAALRSALESGEVAEPVEWEPVADLMYLMQQVPIINNNLRRGVTGRRFKREADKSAGYAASLAAIAQASMFDTDYCADESDEMKWQEICADMRDASAAVSKAVRAGDQATAKVQLGKLVETCDACHHDFRD